MVPNVEQHVLWSEWLIALMNGKIVQNAPAFLSRTVSGLPLPAFISNYLAKKFAEKIKRRVNGVLGGLPKEDLKELLRRDIRAVDDVLQDKKFLFGGKMTATDCAVFGQLATTYFAVQAAYYGST
ncbi:hypothetical protein OESDEN_18445 [Oesophagostomum dentatum]|uniref:Metaxin glutathione S-transferase domain-containing protein n=1 Tax=Oesophagostomum dentatum TaxID=61180 RepID=A0A0B1SD83_OESDE|nr:hypothetical protein OESDEN_18445 [Oesophagostomum dentatum]